MADKYTLKRLTEVEDSAVKGGFQKHQEARFATGDLDAERTGVSLMHVKPGERQAFGHKHDEAEEVYVVFSGSGRVKLDDEIVDVEVFDAIRVAPDVMRQFEAGPEGLTYVAVGTRHEGDGEIVPGWWGD